MGKQIRKIKSFFTGWLLMLTFQDNPQAQRRRAICKGCEHRKNFRCGLCNCPLKALSLANDNSLCDAGKW